MIRNDFDRWGGVGWGDFLLCLFYEFWNQSIQNGRVRSGQQLGVRSDADPYTAPAVLLSYLSFSTRFGARVRPTLQPHNPLTAVQPPPRIEKSCTAALIVGL